MSGTPGVNFKEETIQVLNAFDDVYHEQFINQGYLRLGQVLSADELTALQERIEDIMMGRVRYENMRLQEVGKNSETRRTIDNEDQRYPTGGSTTSSRIRFSWPIYSIRSFARSPAAISASRFRSFAQ